MHLGLHAGAVPAVVVVADGAVAAVCGTSVCDTASVVSEASAAAVGAACTGELSRSCKASG